MISKPDWDKLTPQQQFDYVHLLEETVDSYTEEEGIAVGALKVLAELPEATPEVLFARETLEPSIPHDELPVRLEVSGDGITLFYPHSNPVHIDATSPQYHQQFNQYGNTRLSGD